MWMTTVSFSVHWWGVQDGLQSITHAMYMSAEFMQQLDPTRGCTAGLQALPQHAQQ
jgi:hypothetical protein